jgi:hypothetical protein
MPLLIVVVWSLLLLCCSAAASAASAVAVTIYSLAKMQAIVLISLYVKV